MKKIIFILMLTVLFKECSDTVIEIKKSMNQYEQTLQDLVKQKSPSKQAGWYLKSTGNYALDFKAYTHSNGGGMSNNKKDTASKSMPPEPNKDGKFYHTVNDITWETFKLVMSKHGITATSQLFYNMSKEHENMVTDYFIQNIGGTKSQLINVAISSMEWGGSCKRSLSDFEKKYGYDHIESIEKNGELQTFQMIVLSRIDTLTAISNAKYNGTVTLGWTRSCLVFWKLFQECYNINQAKKTTA